MSDTKNVIEALEELLTRVHSGEIRAVGIVMIHANGEIGTKVPASKGNRHLLVAGAEYLKNDIITAPEEEEDE